MKILLIVESPSKCKKIEEYLGEAYRVVASCGHITSFTSLDQLNMETYEVIYKKEKPKIIKMLKDEIKKASKVILATDDDREGEAIAWHICKVCNLDVETTPRILFNEITKDALQDAIKTPTTINIQRVYSQQTRQKLDLYIGFTISPKLWKYILNKLSAGRCQTPALHMIYEKEKEYENQSYDTIYKINGIFTKDMIEFHLNIPLQQSNIEPFLELCKIYSFKIDKEISESKRIEKRPNILITSTLQQKAHSVLGYSPTQTMNYAQVLYENGLITYMRTDSACYNNIFKDTLKRFITKKFGDDYYKPIENTLKKAHEGIRVTDLSISETTFESKQINKLYQFIHRHTLQTSMSDCIINHIIYKIPAPLDLYFIYQENTIIFEGWKQTMISKESIKYGLYLSRLNIIIMNKITAIETLKTPVYHYCESQIIQKLEKEKIGRPSTYASILSKIQDKNYVKKCIIQGRQIETTDYVLHNNVITKEVTEKISQEEKGKLMITPTGIKVIEFCYKYYKHLFEYEYTQRMENNLDSIEYNNIEWMDVFKQFKSEVDKEVQIDIVKIKQTSLHCGHHNKKPIIIKKGQYGYYVEYNKTNTSLTLWTHYIEIDKYIEDSKFPEDLLENLINFLTIIILNKEYSVRKGKYGDYIYYKSKTMKKPKYYSLEIESRNTEDIKEYIRKKYNIMI